MSPLAPTPFKASFGASPAMLVGRDKQLADFKDALANPPGTHERVAIVTGQRGSGKTVLLNAFGKYARDNGWEVFDETALDGFLDNLKNSVITRLLQISKQLNKKTLTGLSLSFFSIGFSLQWQNGNTNLPNYSLRTALSELSQLQAAVAKKICTTKNVLPPGILLTIDELHHSKSQQIQQLGAVVQHLIRENVNIVVVFAGIPAAIKPLLATDNNANPVTFLRRAHRIELGPVAANDVAAGLTKPLETFNFVWEATALDIAVAGCKGYPFLIQLVGAEIFKLARNSNVISKTHAATAVNNAKTRLNSLVHEPALQGLSELDLAYLTAMAVDDTVSKTAVIADRLGLSTQSANTYRMRLIAQELIVSPERGKVVFALPYLREYLRIRSVSVTNFFD